MHSSTANSLVALLAFVCSASAAVHDVKVGDENLAYSPSSITAAKGDTVVFHFYPGDHNVVQGQFNTPCGTSGGFYSGFIDSENGPANKTFTITIEDTNPIWVYCSQVDHCQQGMAMAINSPSSGNTLAAYVEAAGKTSTSTTPADVGGGVISTGGGAGSSSSSSASSSAPASAKSSTHPSSTSGAAGGGSSSSSAEATTAPATSSTPAGSATSAGGAASTSASPSPTKNAAAAGGLGGENSVLGGVLALLALGFGAL